MRLNKRATGKRRAVPLLLLTCVADPVTKRRWRSGRLGNYYRACQSASFLLLLGLSACGMSTSPSRSSVRVSVSTLSLPHVSSSPVMFAAQFPDTRSGRVYLLGLTLLAAPASSGGASPRLLATGIVPPWLNASLGGSQSSASGAIAAEAWLPLAGYPIQGGAISPSPSYFRVIIPAGTQSLVSRCESRLPMAG